MKSEATKAEEDLINSLAEEIKERLLPEKGASFDIQYFAGEVPVTYGEEPHTWVKAESEGLRIVCDGPEFRVSHSRQRKPIIPDFLKGSDGNYRRLLRIAINGDEVGNRADCYIHILGDQIVVSKKKLNCAALVGEKSLTEADQAIMDEIRREAREAKQKPKE